jgi:hypothetical protein
MIGGLSYQVAHPPFVITGPRPPRRARAPPRTARTGLYTGPEHAKGLAEAHPPAPANQDPTPDGMTDRSQGMTYPTSPCAQRNRLIRANRAATHDDIAEVELQPGDSAEADP